jgi:hypothetical protein
MAEESEGIHTHLVPHQALAATNWSIRPGHAGKIVPRRGAVIFEFMGQLLRNA